MGRVDGRGGSHVIVCAFVNAKEKRERKGKTKERAGRRDEDEEREGQR